MRRQAVGDSVILRMANPATRRCMKNAFLATFRRKRRITCTRDTRPRLFSRGIIARKGFSGFDRGMMVGAHGFEPWTSCAQGRRATRLRYAPTGGGFSIVRHFAGCRYCEASAFIQPRGIVEAGLEYCTGCKAKNYSRKDKILAACDSAATGPGAGK
jgi:hypothetical protein